MKTKIATALSVVGVLGAGSAAALVNTQILDGGPAESGASAAVLPPASSVDVRIPAVTTPTTEPTESSVPAATEPIGSSVSPTTEPTVDSTLAPTTMAPPSEFLTSFNVGEAGVVTVDVIDGRIVLVSAEPKDGWTLAEAEEHADENDVEVEFRSATVRVEFEAAFVDGRIVPTVESYAIGGQSGAAAPAAPSPGQAAPPSATGDDHDSDDSDDHDSDDGDDHDSDDSDSGGDDDGSDDRDDD